MKRCLTVAALALLAIALARWTLHGEDAVPAAVPPAVPGESAWLWQCRLIVDRPALKPFEAGGVRVPSPAKVSLVLVLGAEGDASALVKAAKERAAAGQGVDALWVVAEPAHSERAEAAASGIPGGVAPEACAVAAALREPVLLLVGADGRVAFGHPASSPPDPSVLADQVAWLRREADPAAPLIRAPAPRKDVRGAMACASCHRGEFVDWLFTPHSVAFHDLHEIGRAADETCVGCHVTGWGQPGGFRSIEKDRSRADVQCETCHEPERTHAGNLRLRTEEYAARCRTCHTASASISPDIKLTLPSVSHPLAPRSSTATWEARDEQIRQFREATYFQFCARTAYVGSEACRECHKEVFDQWKQTPHAGSLETLRRAGKSEDARCVRCHTTGWGHEGGFQDPKSTPAVAEVGCEACHGPGKLHTTSRTKEEFEASIFRFDEKCPTCVVQRICRTCHDDENDPGFGLSKALERVRHRKR